MLIHREYTNAFPAKLIIGRGQVRTENSNKPHGFGVLDPATFTPFPKNPVISAFFREIHRADELGSRMRKLMRCGEAYGGADPEMIEGDVFRIVVKVPEYGSNGERGGGPKSSPSRAQEAHDEAHDMAHEPMNDIERRILKICSKSPKSTSDVLRSLGYKSRTGNFKRAINHLLVIGCLEMTIPTKPRSKNQTYRLTQNGRDMLDGKKGGGE